MSGVGNYEKLCAIWRDPQKRIRDIEEIKWMQKYILGKDWTPWERKEDKKDEKKEEKKQGPMSLSGFCKSQTASRD